MKNILFISIFTLLTGYYGFSQSISCQELYEIVTTKYDTNSSVTCFGSSALVKATYYTIDGTGFVVAYLKKNEYDFSGSPYIFCGITSYTWIQFKSDGMTGSWGKAFNHYIRNSVCYCS